MTGLRLAAAAAALVLALAPSPAAAQDAQEAGGQPLTGLLKKVRDTGTITLGYRRSSVPFSYLDGMRRPIGYSLDLCGEIVDEVTAELSGRPVKVAYQPVTAESRIPAVVSGEIDLECGSTTNNRERQKQVAFSPVIFISGTKLLVRRDAKIRSYLDLRDKTVAVTAGTTNEVAIRTLSQKQKLNIGIVVAVDHAEAFQLVVDGKASAFATDDILLFGLIAAANAGDRLAVVGDYLSYDPYGLMFRRNDPAFAALVERVFRRLAESRELVWTYDKWFRKRLPTGERLNVPMGPQLLEIFGTLGLPDEQ